MMPFNSPAHFLQNTVEPFCLLLGIFVLAFIYIYTQTHYLWYTQMHAVCFVNCWKRCIFCVVACDCEDWNRQAKLCFWEKLDKLFFFLMCVSINRFKKNKRTIITLLKSTRWSYSWNILDKCTEDIFSQKQKGAIVAVAILHTIVTGRDEKTECLKEMFFEWKWLLNVCFIF